MSSEDMTQFLIAALQGMKADNHHRGLSPNSFDRGSHAEKLMKISNENFIKRRDKYTSFLKEDLDARDKQIIIPFHFVIDLSKFQTYIEKQKGRYSELIKDPNLEGKKKVGYDYIESIKFTNSEEYDKLLREIQEFLSNMCENVASITFRLLNQGKLTDNEAKAFASKNFIVNIHSLLIEIKNAVNYFTKSEEIEDIMAKITTQIDQSMMKVLQCLANHYPQAHPVGQTARMREIIVNVNQSQDENNDFIFSRDIKIQKYLKLDYGEVSNGYESYTGFIMEVINSAINVTRQYLSEEQEVSVFEKFVEFSERLFCTSQHKHFKDVLKDSTEKKEKVVKYYEKVLEGIEIEVKDVKQIQREKKKLSPAESLEVVKAEFDESLQKMRESHKYAIAQKIPNYVKPFNQNQLKDYKFSVNNSAILRIMTKWAENLEEIFRKPQIHIKQRLYSYKNIGNQLFAPNKEMNDQLFSKLAAQYKIVKSEFNKLKQQNTLLQSYILSHNQAGIDSYLKRFTEVRSASSQINASLIQIMHKYLCILIHHLMKAGQKIDTGSSWQNINLVVFRVNDLLRSKFQCNQTTFLNILNTLYTLDRSNSMENKFKLVRLKNKLNEKDNNILINYMFLGKVQCELQLSIQDMKGKQKNFYNFNHFIYELTRGKFGAITQSAIIVSQHDSTVNSSNDQYYYKPKKYSRKRPVKENYDEQNGIQFKKVHNKDSSLFICKKCKELMVNHNVELLNCRENICNTCLVKMSQPQIMIKHEQLRGYLCRHLGAKVQKLDNYSQIKKDRYVLSLSNTGKNTGSAKLFRVWQHEKQFKIFMIHINKDILCHFQAQDFKFQEFNYIDIKNMQEKKTPINELTYMFQKDCLPDIFALKAIPEEAVDKIDRLIDAFYDFRIEKDLVKSIKFKREIIDLSSNPKKLKKFDELIITQSNNQLASYLKYTKYKNLEFNNLKKLYMTRLNLQELPAHLKYLDQLFEINLQGNQMKTVDLAQFSKLKYLNLNKNKLSEINLDNNPNLVGLHLNDNEIKNLSLLKNLQLSILSAENNQISTLSVMFNPRLTIHLDNQQSENCTVNLHHKPNDLAKCEMLKEQITIQSNEEWRNKNNCNYEILLLQI